MQSLWGRVCWLKNILRINIITRTKLAKDVSICCLGQALNPGSFEFRLFSLLFADRPLSYPKILKIAREREPIWDLCVLLVFSDLLCLRPALLPIKVRLYLNRFIAH